MSILTNRETTEIYVTKKGKRSELGQEDWTQLTAPIDLILKEYGISGEAYVETRVLFQAEGKKYLITDKTLIDKYRNSVKEVAKQFETPSTDESKRMKSLLEGILEQLKDADAIEVKKSRIRTNLMPSWLPR